MKRGWVSIRWCRYCYSVRGSLLCSGSGGGICTGGICSQKVSALMSLFTLPSILFYQKGNDAI